MVVALKMAAPLQSPDLKANAISNHLRDPARVYNGCGKKKMDPCQAMPGTSLGPGTASKLGCRAPAQGCPPSDSRIQLLFFSTPLRLMTR